MLGLFPTSCSSSVAREQEDEGQVTPWEQEDEGQVTPREQEDEGQVTPDQPAKEGQAPKKGENRSRKIAAFADKHRVRPPPMSCQNGCRKRCTENISETQRHR